MLIARWSRGGDFDMRATELPPPKLGEEVKTSEDAYGC